MALSGNKSECAERPGAGEDDGLDVGRSWTVFMIFVLTDEIKTDDRSTRWLTRCTWLNPASVGVIKTHVDVFANHVYELQPTWNLSETEETFFKTLLGSSSHWQHGATLNYKGQEGGWRVVT